MGKNKHLQNLLNKYLNDSCTREEYHELLNVLKRAENEPHIKQMLSEEWNKVLEESHDETLENASQQDWFEEIYAQARIRETTASGEPEQIQPKKIQPIAPKRLRSQWMNIAAILVASLFLSLAFHTFRAEMADGTQEVTTHQRVAAPGEKIRFILSDGTQVHLNSGSQIEFPDSFDENSREVKLDGEAYFVVTSDPERPFMVHSGEITTKVLGTSFNVRSYSDDEEAVVAVASGKVAVLESGSDLLAENYGAVLEANQWTNYRADQHSFDTNSGDISLFTAWNSDVLIYMDDSLEDVAQKFELWYGVDIEFKDDAIKDCIIRGEHRGETLRNVLESITYAFVDMEYVINGREVFLSGRGCR